MLLTRSVEEILWWFLVECVFKGTDNFAVKLFAFQVSGHTMIFLPELSDGLVSRHRLLGAIDLTPQPLQALGLW